jgi:hypothetical protein
MRLCHCGDRRKKAILFSSFTGYLADIFSISVSKYVGNRTTFLICITAIIKRVTCYLGPKGLAQLKYVCTVVFWIVFRSNVSPQS